MTMRFMAIAVLFCQLLWATTGIADETKASSLLNQLRSDDIPGNASRALRKLDRRWGRSEYDLNDMIEELKAYTEDPDPQLRQYASYLLTLVQPSVLSKDSHKRQEFLALFTSAFADDGISSNATHAQRTIQNMIRYDNAEDIRRTLIPLLSSPDYQARQYATYLLVMSYRKAEIPESEWPPKIFENLVEGLRDDEFRLHRGAFSNASNFFQVLLELQENQPMDLVRKELAGSNMQLKYIAAMLLTRWGDYQSRHTIRALLLPHLIDDGGYWNDRYALPAYEALVWFGKEHTRDLLQEYAPAGWQESALLVCAAAFHGETPSFVTDTHRNAWLSRIVEYESTTPDDGYKDNTDAKIATAALYLDPGAASFLSAIEIPPYLKRMLEAGGSLTNLPDRANWMATWFPMLDPEQERASFIISMGYVEHALKE